jgi:hypothetical protein
MFSTTSDPLALRSFGLEPLCEQNSTESGPESSEQQLQSELDDAHRRAKLDLP